MYFRTRLPHDFTTRIASFRAGTRTRYTLWNKSDLTTDVIYSESNRPFGFRRLGNGNSEVNFVPHRVFYENNRDVWIREIELRYSGRTTILRPDFPIGLLVSGDLNLSIFDTKALYNSINVSGDVTPITAEMFDLRLEFTPARPNPPVYIDVPDSVGGQGDADTSYRLPDGMDTIRLRGYADNRHLAAWSISYVTPRSLPVRTFHAHFTPFVNPAEMRELEQLGISVYIDEFGLVHFPTRAAFEGYLLARHSGDKFSREWVASRDSAKGAYAAVAPELPDKLIASKSAMVTNFEASIRGGALERGLQRYQDPEVLSELFDQSLDQIVSIEQAKRDKIVRSVIKKRDLADRLDAIITFYRNSPDSPLTLPAGLSDGALRSLISQPLSKLMRSLSSEASDAYLADQLAPDLITRLGFARRGTP